jgi:hypothetical protein
LFKSLALRVICCAAVADQKSTPNILLC